MPEEDVLKDLIKEKPKAKPQELKPSTSKVEKKGGSPVKKAKWYKLDNEAEVRTVAPGIVACRFSGGLPFILDGKFKINTIDGVYFTVESVVGR